MKKIGIMVDLLSGLVYVLFDYYIKIIKIIIYFGEEILIDGVDIIVDDFYLCFEKDLCVFKILVFEIREILN